MRALEMMLAELESSRLEVILVPQRRWTNEGGMVRVAISRNCRWYSRFCGQHLSGRRRKNAAPDTRIKRQHTVAALERMIAGERSTYYFDELKKIAQRFVQ